MYIISDRNNNIMTSPFQAAVGSPWHSSILYRYSGLLKLMPLRDRNLHQHTLRSTYPFKNVKIKKGWGQEEDQYNSKTNLSELNTSGVRRINAAHVGVDKIFITVFQILFEQKEEFLFPPLMPPVTYFTISRREWPGPFHVTVTVTSGYWVKDWVNYRSFSQYH